MFSWCFPNVLMDNQIIHDSSSIIGRDLDWLNRWWSENFSFSLRSTLIAINSSLISKSTLVVVSQRRYVLKPKYEQIIFGVVCNGYPLSRHHEHRFPPKLKRVLRQGRVPSFPWFEAWSWCFPTIVSTIISVCQRQCRKSSATFALFCRFASSTAFLSLKSCRTSDILCSESDPVDLNMPPSAIRFCSGLIFVTQLWTLARGRTNHTVNTRTLLVRLRWSLQRSLWVLRVDSSTLQFYRQSWVTWWLWCLGVAIIAQLSLLSKHHVFLWKGGSTVVLSLL
jgi:hypothetical protein